MYKPLTPDQREALHRCYQLLLSLPGPDPGQTEPEESGEFGDQTDSSGGTPVLATERNCSLPQGAPTSTNSCDSGGDV